MGGVMYRGLRGDGVYKDDRRIRVSDVFRAQRFDLVLFRVYLGSCEPERKQVFSESGPSNAAPTRLRRFFTASYWWPRGRAN